MPIVTALIIWMFGFRPCGSLLKIPGFFKWIWEQMETSKPDTSEETFDIPMRPQSSAARLRRSVKNSLQRPLPAGDPEGISV